MYKSPLCLFTSRTSSVHAWLRLALAASVLALYTAIALASGVARADDSPSASGGESGTTSTTSPQQSGSGSPGTGAASGTTSAPGQHAGVGHPSSLTGGTAGAATEAGPSTSVRASQRVDPDRHVTGSTSTNGPESTATAESTGPTSPAPQHTDTTGPPQGTPADAGAQAETPATGDPTTPETPQPTVAVEVPAEIDATGLDAEPVTVTPLPADVSHNAKRSGQPASVAATASVEPGPAVAVAPTLGSLGSPVAPEPAAAIVATVDPGPSVVPSVDPSNPVPAIQPQPGLQVPGLISDVGTIAVSVVHAVATSVAQAFGPDSFLGVPYLLATAVANVAAGVGRTIVGAPLFDTGAGPFPVTYGILDALSIFNPTKPPAGANDPSITVTPEHPLPIILLNGTATTQGTSWSVGAPVLANAGYKVYTFNYGNITSDPNYPIQATADIRQSGLELAAEVDRVLAETGAPKVILIGYSQGGGILPVHYINNLGGAAKVSQLIGLAPSNHGSDFSGLAALGPLFLSVVDLTGPALRQQTVGSPFQDEVYGNGDTRPGVLYTNIISVNDEVVTPYTQQALTGPNVTNIILQDRYPGQVIGHVNMIVSPQAFALVLDALASNPAANPMQDQDTVAA